MAADRAAAMQTMTTTVSTLRRLGLVLCCTAVGVALACFMRYGCCHGSLFVRVSHRFGSRRYEEGIFYF